MAELDPACPSARLPLRNYSIWRKRKQKTKNEEVSLFFAHLLPLSFTFPLSPSPLPLPLPLEPLALPFPTATCTLASPSLLPSSPSPEIASSPLLSLGFPPPSPRDVLSTEPIALRLLRLPFRALIGVSAARASPSPWGALFHGGNHGVHQRSPPPSLRAQISTGAPVIERFRRRIATMSTGFPSTLCLQYDRRRRYQLCWN